MTERLRYQGFSLRLESGFGPDEARAVVDRVLASSGDRIRFGMLRPDPPALGKGGEVPRLFVKAEFRRPHEALSKRMRCSRSVAEGRGSRAFREAGVPTPDLYLFGEQSRMRPRSGSILCTRHIRRPNAVGLYREGPDLAVGRRVARAVARIHARGLVHGDAVLRNFVPEDDTVWAVDLARCAEASTEGILDDLAHLVGSAMTLGADHAHVNQLLCAYRDAPEAPVMTLPSAWQTSVLESGGDYHRHVTERVATREERRARTQRSLFKAAPRKGREQS